MFGVYSAHASDDRVYDRGKVLAVLVAMATILAFAGALWLASSAVAGTYTIYDCPSASSSTPGPWQIGGGASQKTTCSGGLGDFIGTLGGQMCAGCEWGMSVSAPQGETLTQSSIYWYVTGKSSGGDVFSEEWSGGSELENGENTFDARYVPDTHTLPTGATSIVIAVYCSTDDYSNPCSFSSSQTPVLEMLGSAITVSDPTAPTGGLTGGGLDGSGPVSATQSISYKISDSLAGISSVQLLVDGTVVATDSYASSCSFTNFQPCLASGSGSLSWDTGTVPNGAHEVELLVTNAAGDTTVIGDHAITTSNSPVFASPPAIAGSPAVGQTLTTTPGQVSSDAGAGSPKASARWLRCDPSGGSCDAIPSATGTSYSVAAADEGHMLRYQETVANNDGSSTAESTPFGPIQKETTEAREAKEREAREREAKEKEAKEKEIREREARESKGANGTNGVNGANGTNGANGSVTVNVNGSNQGAAVLGSTARWAIFLRVSPSKVRRHTKIKLSGFVSTSPRPSEGKLIYLQARTVGAAWRRRGGRRYRVRAYGKWVTFQALRAKTSGSFSSTYTFRLGGHHTYQFQAVAPAEGQYRNPTGTSKTITVHEI